MTLRPLSVAIALLLPGFALAESQPPHDAERERARQLDQVVITASPLRNTSENLVQPVEILAGEKLDDARAGTLGETLNQVLGVQTSFFGIGVGRPIIRGQEGARVQVLSEGISSMDASVNSVDHAVSIEPFLADQIEVLKGPATLLYGAGAIGGAVNVVDGRIPSEVPEGITGRAELRGGTVADERSGMFRVDGGSGRIAWHLDAFRRKSEDYKIPGFARVEDDHDHDHDHYHDDHHHHDDEENPFGILPGSAVDTRGGAVGLSFVGDRAFFGLAVSRYESIYGVPGHGHHHHDDDDHHHDQRKDGGHDHEEEEEVFIDLAQTRYDFKGGIEQPFAGFESLNFRMGINNYRHFEIEEDENGTRFDNDAWEARVDLVHAPWNGWRGAFGLQAGRRDFSAVGEEAFVPPSLSRDLGVFLIEEQDFDSWKLELGARADRNRIRAEDHAARSFSAFSASVGALWRTSDLLHFSAAFDRAQRAPNAEELYSDGPHLATSAFEIGDPDLKRETANQIELAAHLHAGPLSGKLAVFNNRFNDHIYLAETGEEEDDLPVRQWTQADARFRGIEAEANLMLADNGSGQWSMRLFGDRVDATLKEGGRLPRIAPARSGLGFDWNREGWRAGVDAVRYARQDKVADFESASEGFTLFNANLVYHWDVGNVGWEVFLRANNLTDREARMHTSVLKDVAPLPGRNLLFGIRSFF